MYLHSKPSGTEVPPYMYPCTCTIFIGPSFSPACDSDHQKLPHFHAIHQPYYPHSALLPIRPHPRSLYREVSVAIALPFSVTVSFILTSLRDFRQFCRAATAAAIVLRTHPTALDLTYLTSCASWLRTARTRPLFWQMSFRPC